MATKWKNSLLLMLAVLFCLGGWYVAYASFNRINDVRGTHYAMSRTAVESIYLTENLEELTVTKPTEISQEQVDVYRYRYGGLETQVFDIKGQYQPKIELVKEEKEKKKLEKERDKKIAAVVQNFTDDEAVKNKIIEEEKKYIEANKKTIEADVKLSLEHINNYYYYYFKDIQTGEVYTNLNGLTKYSTDKDVKGKLEEDGMGKIYQDEYPMNFNSYVMEEAREQGLFQSTKATLEGNYSISKDSSLAKEWIKQEQGKKLFNQLLYAGLFSMLVGIGVLYIYINTTIIYSWMKKLPIDIAILVFLGAGFVAAFLGTYIYPYNLGTAQIFRMLAPIMLFGVSSILLAFINFKIIWHKLLPKHRKKELLLVLKESLLYRLFSYAQRIFKHLSLGIKLLVILLVGIFTAVLGLVFLNTHMGSFSRLFIGILLLILIPFEIKISYQIIKKIKKILRKPKIWLREYEQETSSEVSLDEFDKELIQLNQLIEISKKDTMQSETLKAELLTNVSHDLRTPLTSIIIC